ncbi:MAG: class I SAM-dependent methyltransferase [Proteobacteria bacterium]|nr:class I SAM-dependent methyltransferase [Pseudomonadota bacterium]
MGRIRRFYYDLFSHFYDGIIDLHSRDKSAALRDYLVRSSGIGPGDCVLDICTGTGSVALRAALAVREGRGKVVALDFSLGMLRKTAKKVRQRDLEGVFPVQADVSDLPFPDGSFDCVTCSHAMYELTAMAREKGLGEIRRVLKDGGRFLMMEHEVPERPFIRFLYKVRLLTMGSGQNREFAKDETAELGEHFSDIRKSSSPTGRSRLLSGKKIVGYSGNVP